MLRRHFCTVLASLPIFKFLQSKPTPPPQHNRYSVSTYKKEQKATMVFFCRDGSGSFTSSHTRLAERIARALLDRLNISFLAQKQDHGGYRATLVWQYLIHRDEGPATVTSMKDFYNGNGLGGPTFSSTIFPTVVKELEKLKGGWGRGRTITPRIYYFTDGDNCATDNPIFCEQLQSFLVAGGKFGMVQIMPWNPRNALAESVRSLVRYPRYDVVEFNPSGGSHVPRSGAAALPWAYPSVMNPYVDNIDIIPAVEELI